MSTTSSKIIGFQAQLERSVQNTIETIRRVCSEGTCSSAELRRKYLPALRDIDAVKIVPLPASAGSFIVSNGVLQLTEEPIARLLHCVLDDVRASGEKLSDEDISSLIDAVICVYALHEIRHRTQGIEDLEQVADIRKIAGGMAMAEFDALADRDAAFAYAIIRAAPHDRREYLLAFREALFFSTSYFFKVFPIQGRREDKVARALSVLLMLARFATIEPEPTFVEDPEFPLDAPMTVLTNADLTDVAIVRPEPSRSWVKAIKDSDEVAAIAASLTAGNTKDALSQAVSLARTLNI